jgi:hypothetical protein
MLVADLPKKGKVNQEIRDLRGCPNLKGGRQGDVYIVRCDTPSDIEKLEKLIRGNSNYMWSDFSFGNKFESRGSQLASGTSKGSRHVFNGKGLVEFCKNGHPCAGGIIKAETDWTLTHPEHAHFKFLAGSFVFFFQLDASKKCKILRVRD